MRIFLTGHDGYIGSVLGPSLLAAGHDVIGCDTRLFERCTFGKKENGIPSIRKDIRDITSGDLRGFDAVLHFAALTGDPLKTNYFEPFLVNEINHHASVQLATHAKKAKVERFIFSSSCSGYESVDSLVIDETSAFTSSARHEHEPSKIDTERDISMLSDANFAPTYLRHAMAYGFSPRLRLDLLLNNMVSQAYIRGKIHIQDPNAWLPMVHIEDISRAVLAALSATPDRVRDQAFNVGRTDQNFSVRQLAEIVSEAFPGSRLEFAETKNHDARGYRVNCDKFKHAFGDILTWDVRRGVLELREAYLDIHATREEFESPRYRRADHLRMLVEQGLISKQLRPLSSTYGRMNSDGEPVYQTYARRL